MEWQPIEIAPKDGSSVLTYAKTPYGERIEPAFFCKEDTCWYFTYDGEYDGHQPTHWMPLPAAPKEQS